MNHHFVRLARFPAQFCKPTASVGRDTAPNGKRAVVFAHRWESPSPSGLKALPQTSSDTKRFARTVREADSSTGWREDEQPDVLVASF